MSNTRRMVIDDQPARIEPGPSKAWEQQNSNDHLLPDERVTSWGWAQGWQPAQPVPRQASCHFYNTGMTRSASNFYFY